ncbi:MAG: hypothetical protein FWD59_09050, partial [Micrococcales bacterium]|nr:hypothetical protein [Micrococcales bacterium]
MPTIAHLLVALGALLALSAAVLLIFRISRRRAWSGRAMAISTLAACLAIGGTGAAIVTATPTEADFELTGVYVFAEELYTNPLSSYRPFGSTPYVYGVFEDEFIVGDMSNGVVNSYAIDRHNTPVDVDEFTKSSVFSWSNGSSFSPPRLDRFRQRRLVATITENGEAAFALYRMDDELWLVEPSASNLWFVYQLKPAEVTTIADLERAREHSASHPYDELEFGAGDDHLTMDDVYALARKGASLALSDLDPFTYHLSGEDFAERRYDVVGADTVFLRERDGVILSILLLSRRSLDRSDAIDLREGFEAVAEYQDPLRSFDDLMIEKGPYLGGERDLLFEDDYFESHSRYYLDVSVAETYVTFDGGERMTAAQALRERRTSIEDLHAAGLQPLYMVPIDNPLGGEFPMLSNSYAFQLNGEPLFPSSSFVYLSSDGRVPRCDVDELSRLLAWYGHDTAAQALLAALNPADVSDIVG